jgi:flagellar protein FlaH
MPARIPSLTEKGGSVVITTGNGELEPKIAGGFPPGMLILVQSGNDTGKSMPPRQIMNGVMKQGAPVDHFTAGNTTRNYVRQRESMRPEVTGYFTGECLLVFPHDVVGFKWNKEEMVNI